MKRPIKSGLVTLQKPTKTRGSTAWKSSKMLPETKSLSCVDQVTAFCWDAAIKSINVTTVTPFSLLPLLLQRPTRRLSGNSADRSLIQNLCDMKERLAPSFSAASLSWNHPLVLKQVSLMFFPSLKPSLNHRQACCT